VWRIATRSSDDFASALVNVPLHELTVTENMANRLRPDYRWGDKTGTRFTSATPEGRFVHIMYPTGEPMALRGSGPLQLCRAAASVSVEAQAWAAQFYADGGGPSVLIKHASDLSPELDEDGLSEADRLRSQWVGRPHNVPRIIDQNIESVDYMDPNPAGAQMLEARVHQDGDSARMFRIPGSLLEFSTPGSSLTYQNLEGEFTKFVRTCLQPLYLEPIEQALSDLLARSVVARFNLKAFLRPDAKTRFEVHGLAIDKGIYDAAYAQREEGILPGDVEFASVPPSLPAAVPGPMPRYASLSAGEVRCDGPHPRGGVCGKLLAERGPYVGSCPRCKTVYSGFDGPRELTAEPERPTTEVHIHFPDGMVRVETPVTIADGAIHVDAPMIPSPPAMTLAVTMPDTEMRIAGMGADLARFAQTVDSLALSQAIAHDESQARLAEVSEANRDVARSLERSLKPRKVIPIRDPDTKQIVGMTSEVA
jgi:phage FluMu protein Com